MPPAINLAPARPTDMTDALARHHHVAPVSRHVQQHGLGKTAVRVEHRRRRPLTAHLPLSDGCAAEGVGGDGNQPPCARGTFAVRPARALKRPRADLKRDPEKRGRVSRERRPGRELNWSWRMWRRLPGHYAASAAASRAVHRKRGGTLSTRD